MKVQSFTFLDCVCSASLFRKRRLSTWVAFLFLTLCGFCRLARFQSHCLRISDLGRHSFAHLQSPNRLSLLFAPHGREENDCFVDRAAPPHLGVRHHAHQHRHSLSSGSRSYRYPIKPSSRAAFHEFDAFCFTSKEVRLSSITRESLSVSSPQLLPGTEGVPAFFSSRGLSGCFSAGSFLQTVASFRFRSPSRPQRPRGRWNDMLAPPSALPLLQSTSGHQSVFPALLERSETRPAVSSLHHRAPVDFREVRHSTSGGSLVAPTDRDGFLARTDDAKLDPPENSQEACHLPGSERTFQSSETADLLCSRGGECLLDRSVWARKLSEFGTNVEDVVEQCVKGGGKGGQKINKTNSCVVIVHLPRGLVIRCQQSRSQRKNRIRARGLLLQKLQESLLQHHQHIRDTEEKERRRNRQPTEAQKARVRAEKQRHSERKEQRRRISSFDV
uniref:Peptidyl-tRNA hydrolase domain-containing protein, putative n=1 Tax=Neospora caninum (strain Liverpool) TaxID=572307 RepID=A0A0F7UHY0_NEOCL|nr:TPA: peptidyl-tRNA hydrolase domain-containing protein, putative [Neospora caninum Liverpool]